MKRKTKKILGWCLLILIFLIITLAEAASMASELHYSYLLSIGITLIFELCAAVFAGLIYLAIWLII